MRRLEDGGLLIGWLSLVSLAAVLLVEWVARQ